MKSLKHTLAILLLIALVSIPSCKTWQWGETFNYVIKEGSHSDVKCPHVIEGTKVWGGEMVLTYNPDRMIDTIYTFSYWNKLGGMMPNITSNFVKGKHQSARAAWRIDIEDPSYIYLGYIVYVKGSEMPRRGYLLTTGGDLDIRGGGNGSTGDGGDLLLRPGDAVSGSRGSIHFGTVSDGYLPVDNAEANLVAYDITTGLLSSRTVASISGGGYWSKSSTELSPATSGDDILLAVSSERIMFGDGDSYISEVMDDIIRFTFPSSTGYEFRGSGIFPVSSGTQDLGSVGFPYDDLFVNDVTVNNDLTVSGAIYGSVVNTINNQTGSTYTLVLSDASKLITCDYTSGNMSFTIPTNASVAFPIGTVIKVVQLDVSPYNVIFSGTPTILTDGTYNSLRGENTVATFTKIATDTWLAEGLNYQDS